METILNILLDERILKGVLFFYMQAAHAYCDLHVVFSGCVSSILY